MKTNKYILIFSVVTTILSLALYLFFVLRCSNQIGIDISIAIFGGSIIIIFSSLISYFVDKRRLQDSIISNSTIEFSAELLLVLDDDYTLNRRALVQAVFSTLHNVEVLRKKLADYFTGCFCKDKKLKEFINVDLRDYTKNLSRCYFDLSNTEVNTEEIKSKVTALINEGDNLRDELSDWMKKSKFILGEEFEINKEQNNGKTQNDVDG